MKTFTEFKNCKTGCLYNIQDDPYEKEDLAEKKPNLVKTMMDRLATLNKSIFKPDRGTEQIEVSTRNSYFSFDNILLFRPAQNGLVTLARGLPEYRKLYAFMNRLVRPNKLME